MLFAFGIELVRTVAYTAASTVGLGVGVLVLSRIWTPLGNAIDGAVELAGDAKDAAVASFNRPHSACARSRRPGFFNDVDGRPGLDETAFEADAAASRAA